jgi:plasmid stability protein
MTLDCALEDVFMKDAATRSTIYFEPDLHRALRLKAAHTHSSLSNIVNEAVRQALQEDQEDLASFDERAKEPLISYEELLKDLKKKGKI